MSSFYGTVGKQGPQGEKGEPGDGLFTANSLEEIDSTGVYLINDELYLSSEIEGGFTAEKLILEKEAEELRQNSCNAIKGHAHGNVLRLDNVISSLPHKIKIESKNLFSTAFYSSSYNIKETSADIQGEQNTFSLTSNSSGNGQCSVSFKLFLKKGEYYISGNISIIRGENTPSETTDLAGGFSITDSYDSFILNAAKSDFIQHNFKIPRDDTYTILFYGDYEPDIGTKYTYTDIQLEKGNVKTEYSSYVGKDKIICSGYGKNIYNKNDTSKTNEGEERFQIFIPKGTTLTISSKKHQFVDEETGKIYHSYFGAYKENGEAVQLLKSGVSESLTSASQSEAMDNRSYCTVTLEEDAYSITVAKWGRYKSIAYQVEIGESPTDYEYYIEEVSSYEKDGDINLKSIAPTMIIIPNSSNTTIKVEYNKDIKAYIDEKLGGISQ